MQPIDPASTSAASRAEKMPFSDPKNSAASVSGTMNPTTRMMFSAAPDFARPMPVK